MRIVGCCLLFVSLQWCQVYAHTKPREHLTTLALAKREHSGKGLPPGWAKCTFAMDDRAVVAAFDATAPDSSLAELAQEFTDAFYLETMAPNAFEIIKEHIFHTKTTTVSQPGFSVEDRDYLPRAEEQTTNLNEEQEHIHITLIFQAQVVMRDWLVDILGPPDTNQTNPNFSYSIIDDQASLKTVLPNALVVYTAEQCEVRNLTLLSYLDRFDQAELAYGVITLHDERISGCRAHYPMASVVLRNTGHPSFWGMRTRENVLEFPIGYQHKRQVEQGDMILSSERKYDWTFMGDTSKSMRKQMVEALFTPATYDSSSTYESDKKKHICSKSPTKSNVDDSFRKDACASHELNENTISAIQQNRNVLLHETNNWEDSNRQSPHVFRSVLSDSAFSPCPIGNLYIFSTNNIDVDSTLNRAHVMRAIDTPVGTTALASIQYDWSASHPVSLANMRIYESLEQGAIPVVENLTVLFNNSEQLWRDSEALSLGRYGEFNPPFVFVKPDWSDAKEKLEALVASPSRLDALQRANAEWYEKQKVKTRAAVRSHVVKQMRKGLACSEVGGCRNKRVGKLELAYDEGEYWVTYVG